MKRSRQPGVIAALALAAALLSCAGCMSPEQDRYEEHLNARVLAGPPVPADTVAAGVMNDRSVTREALAREEE